LADAIRSSGASYQIIGHTDTDGDAAYNQTLSEKRAAAVKNALVGMGADASRLITSGKGESQPVDDNMTVSGKANNRRVEFIRQ
jgi:outer membrane protein OmpA-like peptidoglycan-associated protein